MEDMNTETKLEQLAETALRAAERVMDLSIQLTHAGAEIRLVANRLGDTVVSDEREEMKRETLKIWLEMADYIDQAVATLDGRAQRSLPDADTKTQPL